MQPDNVLVFYGRINNVNVLPPGQGRAVGVDVVGFMPVGRDVLFDFFDGSVTQNLRTHAAGNLTGCPAERLETLPSLGNRDPTRLRRIISRYLGGATYLVALISRVRALHVPEGQSPR